jgi:3-phosphoshikimate 1-carboxyvinyltransferase
MKHYPRYLDLQPAMHACGVVQLPGSKSISNRTLLLAALAEGTTHIFDLLASDDTHVMLTALHTLGINWEQVGETRNYVVHGGGGMFPVHHANLFMGNAGTAIRPLTAALAVLGGDYTLHGVARMHERPIGDLADALNAAGAQIEYLEQPGFPPLRIRRGHIHAQRMQVRGNVSSQFLTALLMAAPLMAKEHAVSIEVIGELISKPYIEITLNLMRRFGVEVVCDDWRCFTLAAGQHYVSPGSIHVEGDASSASYFLAAGAIAGGPVRVQGIGLDSIQGDVQFVDALRQMGATITAGDNWIEAQSNGVLKAIDADFNHIPDAAMTIAVAALYADGPSMLRNIGSWRVKETDRIAAMATELRKLGAQVEEGEDTLRVTPPAEHSAQKVAIDTYDDHRMAMCFSLTSLNGAARRGNMIRINDPQCVAKTFPDYFDVFSHIVQKNLIPVIAIDGPTASGKGTVAQRVAERLGFHYLDSGALYRLAALSALRTGIPLSDEQALAKAAGNLQCSFPEGKIMLSNEEVTDAIRAEEIGIAASKIAVLPMLRQALHSLQLHFCALPGLVADGRDMGSVVFPHALLKVFLTASPEARAKRRYKQLIDKGFSANIKDLLQDLQERDARDSNRAVAPLKPAAGAYLLDTSAMTADQAVEQVLHWYKEVITMQEILKR